MGKTTLALNALEPGDGDPRRRWPARPADPDRRERYACAASAAASAPRSCIPSPAASRRTGAPSPHHRRAHARAGHPRRRTARASRRVGRHDRRRQLRQQGSRHRRAAGSCSTQGHVFDEVVAVGPLPMMRAVCEVTRPLGLKTIVSLNPIMIDGTGMCGGCRVTVGGEAEVRLRGRPGVRRSPGGLRTNWRRGCAPTANRKRRPSSSIDIGAGRPDPSSTRRSGTRRSAWPHGRRAIRASGRAEPMAKKIGTKIKTPMPLRETPHARRRSTKWRSAYTI